MTDKEIEAGIEKACECGCSPSSTGWTVNPFPIIRDYIERLKRRAELAERALVLMARGECTFASPEFYKEEAEKEIAMEEQMMANRCGEGKCEYFESIRRAANNNRVNGYCKKYKRELLLYDWWWLKCNECTAEKELAEEEKGE